jgi:hypothetical protein
MGSKRVTSPAIKEMAYVPGRLLSPWPRRSIAKTGLLAHSFAAMTSQSPAVAPVPGSMTTGGQAALPHGHDLTAIVTPSTSCLSILSTRRS